MSEDIDSEIQKNRKELKNHAVRSYLVLLIQSEIDRAVPFAESLEIMENISYEQAMARILPTICDVVTSALEAVNYKLPEDIDVRLVATHMLCAKNKDFSIALASMSVSGGVGIRVTDIVQKSIDAPDITAGIPSTILK